MFVGGVAYGGAAMLKIPVSCFKAAVFLSPIVVSGIVGAGLREAFIRFAAACIDTSSGEILGNVRLSGKNSVLSETLSLAVLGM